MNSGTALHDLRLRMLQRAEQSERAKNSYVVSQPRSKSKPSVKHHVAGRSLLAQQPYVLVHRHEETLARQLEIDRRFHAWRKDVEDAQHDKINHCSTHIGIDCSRQSMLSAPTKGALESKSRTFRPL